MELVLEWAFRIMFLLAAAVLALGWIVLLVIGIVRRRRGKSGVGLIIGGAAWGLIILAMVGLGAYAYYLFAHALDEIPEDVMRDTFGGPEHVEKFDPAQYKGPMGRIAVAYKGEASLELSPLQGDKRLKVAIKDGTALAPVGVYGLKGFEAVARDKSNAKWTASCDFYESRQKEINVRADSSTALDVWPPSASIVAEHVGTDKASFDLSIEGPAGQSYSITKDGCDSGDFAVLSKAGETLWQGKFEAG